MVGKIQLIVAIPPVEVSMKMGEKFITGPIKINLEEQKKASNISCVATGARPAPKFKWTIGDNEILNSNTTTSEELLDEGRGTYTSTLIYTGQPRDIAQMLKCEVIHEGYQKHQLEDENNLAEAQLNLSFKPDRDADITYDVTTSKKSKNMVKVMFRANPKPTSGIWWIGSTEIPTGEIVSYIEDPGFHFESSYFSDGDLEGEYQVTLEFNGMLEEENHNSILSVTNDLGTTNYTLFKGGVISEGIFWFGPILKLRIMKSSKGQ